MVEIDDGDARTDPVCVRDEVRVHAGLRMTEVCAGGNESRESDVGGRDGSVEGMVRLEGVVSCLSRAILGECVDCVHSKRGY